MWRSRYETNTGEKAKSVLLEILRAIGKGFAKFAGVIAKKL